MPTVMPRVVMLAQARSRAEVRATQTQTRLAAMLAHTVDVLPLVDDAPPYAATIRSVSPLTRRRLGVEPATLLGRSPAVLAAEFDGGALTALLSSGGGADAPRRHGPPHRSERRRRRR